MPETNNQPKDSKIQTSINQFFQNVSYEEQYSGDIWLTILIILFICILTIYFYIINSLQSIKSQWYKYKCNPFIMPFASIINPEANELDNDYTNKNFEQCLDEMNKKLGNKVRGPIDIAIGTINNIFTMGADIFTQVQNFIIYLFNVLLELFKLFLEKISRLLTEINGVIINAISFLGHIMAMFSSFYYIIIVWINSMKLMFTIFALGFLVSMVIPSIVSVILTWYKVITSFMVIRALWKAVPWTWTTGTMAIAIAVFVFWLILAIVFTILMILFVFIYSVIARFAQDVLENTIPDAPTDGV